MFLENDYARPLFDFEKGGKAKAFECLMCPKDKPKITRTERGMRMHLKFVHNWKEQPCLYSTDHPTEHGSADHRAKLRVSLKPRKENEDKPTETSLSQKSHETNEGELLKLMKEGN